MSEIHRLFTRLSDIINRFLLEMLHKGTAISVIVCNCMSFFVISFVVYFPETLILGSFNTEALLLETTLCPL